MPRLWGQLNLISKPNTCMSVYIGVLFHTCGTFIFFYFRAEAISIDTHELIK